jgi:hypothetical protein
MLGDFLDALFSDSGAPDRYYHRPSEGVESLDSKARAREVAVQSTDAPITPSKKKNKPNYTK